MTNEVTYSIALYGCRRISALHGSKGLMQWPTTKMIQTALNGCVRDAGFAHISSRIHYFSKDPADGYQYLMAKGQTLISIRTYPSEGTVSVWMIITCPAKDGSGAMGRTLRFKLRNYFEADGCGSGVLGAAPLCRIA